MRNSKDQGAAENGARMCYVVFSHQNVFSSSSDEGGAEKGEDALQQALRWQASLHRQRLSLGIYVCVGGGG